MHSQEKTNDSPESRDDQRQARRDAIIDAAQEMFAERPFSRVSMRDIARRVGISPALIYRSFPSQQHLFVEAFLRGTQDLIPVLDERIDATDPVRIEEAARIFIDYLTGHEQYFKMMTQFMLEGAIDEELRGALDGIERSILDSFDRLFMKAGAGSDVRRLSHAFFAALNGVLITYRQHPGRSPEQVREHMDTVARTISRVFESWARSASAGR